MTQNNNKPIHGIRYYDEEKTKKYYEYWILNGEHHREDGPAVIGYRKDGSIWYEYYFLNGKQHREDGPAFIKYYTDGSIWYEYYNLNGCNYSKEEYLKLIPPQNRIKVLINDAE